MVLSLETGALISVWLCWLSFSSISSVQQEKPCGHTFNGAPGRHEENTHTHTHVRHRKLPTQVTSTQNQTKTKPVSSSRPGKGDSI